MASTGGVGGAWQALSGHLQGLATAAQGDKHLRGATDGRPIYVHGDKTHGVSSRQPKYQEGVRQIKAALDQDFGPGFGDFAFKQLGKTKAFFEASPEKGLRLKDVGKLDQIANNYGTTYEEVHADDMFKELGAATFFKMLESVDKRIANAPQEAQADANKLTPLQKVAIHGYTSTKICYGLNRELRAHHGDTTSLSDHAKAYIKHITDGLAALPAPKPDPERYELHEGQILVYRGAKHMSRAVDDGYQTKASVTEHAFTSTSASDSKGFYGAFQFTIALSSNMAGRDVSAFSPYNEKEILFPPGTQFDVIHREGKADLLRIQMEAGTGVEIAMRERKRG